MFTYARFIAIFLALFVSSVTMFVLSLFEEATFNMLLLTFLVAFVVAVLPVFYLLEFQITKEVKRIYYLINKLRKKDFSIVDSDKEVSLLLLKGINKEIITYAKNQQHEIEELKKVEAFRKEFIANISHELKTPIFAAQGFVHTLLDGALEDKVVLNKFLKKAGKSLDGLDVLVQDLLVLSQIETGDIRMNFEYFDLNKMTLDIIDQFLEKAKRKQIDLKYEPSDSEVIVYADWQRVGQVMNNLISNAINYTNEGGEVTVLLNPEGTHVKVTIADNGIGIPPDDLRRIFERFYRVDKSRSRASGGTGLGLAIVKHILEGHNTSMKVKSHPGHGSEFSFKLPVNEV